MPTYDYLCTACGHRLEIFQPITEGAKRKCPECKGMKLERQIGAGAGILFKGSGFYQTDYRSDSYKKGAEAEESSRKESESKSDSSGSSGSKKGDSKKDAPEKSQE